MAGDFLEEVSEYLLPGKTAVIAELDEEWQAPIDTRMEALGGHVFRRNRIAVEDAYYERQIAAELGLGDRHVRRRQHVLQRHHAADALGRRAPDCGVMAGDGIAGRSC